MEFRKWPSRRPPPAGWVVSPELSDLYGYNVIVRTRSFSKVRRAAREAERDSTRDNHLKREGKRQMILGGILSALGIGSMWRRR